MTSPSAAAGRLAASDLASRLSRKALPGLLFAAILSGFFVYVEPSPYEFLVGLLALAAVCLGLTVDRKLLPLVLLLLLWNIAGLASLLPVLHDGEAIKFLAISFYLAFSAVLFACLFLRDSLQRLEVVRRAYVLAAVLAALAGVAGYFHLVPGADLFTLSDRARGTFKDPNVYAPFLILPALFLAERIVSDGMRLHRVIAMALIVVGLFLSFSRGAWMHFVVSATFLVALMFLAAPTVLQRRRILALAWIAAIGAVGLITVLLSFDPVGNLFEQRASILQEYDSPDTGRFGRQTTSLPVLLERPNGVGPVQFRQHFGQDPHNVYLNAFASYGWIGGIAYLLLVLSTLYVGFRHALTPTPWQPYLIPALATFVGLALEGFVVDTDHWRHFYLILGIIWALATSTANASQGTPHRSR
jgi:O-antigen ligase